MKQNIQKYFLDLVKFPTPADTDGLTEASLPRFLACARYLEQELRQMGIEEVELTEEGYVYATIPASQGYESRPTIALMAHYDTALENPPTRESSVITPQVWDNYDGKGIDLPKGGSINDEELKDKVGHTIITGSGDIQLGADDKAGVAVILAAARFVVENNSARPKTKLIFNNNEEVGRGVEFLDYEKVGADYAYCIDGGGVGELFVENFNAEAVTISIEGKTVHPGYAKGKMVNAITIANQLISSLEERIASPERSEGRESYLGINSISGSWTKVDLHYLLRAFEKVGIEEIKQVIDDEISFILDKYPNVRVSQSWDENHRYKNAGEILDKYPELNEKAKEAYEAVGVEVVPDLVRGGFDGVNMSFAGLPTTNLFNGAMNMHGLDEWVSLEDMELSARMVVNLLEVWTQ